VDLHSDTQRLAATRRSLRMAPKRAPGAKVSGDPAASTSSEKQARWVIMGLIGFMAIGLVVSVVLTLFPDQAPVVQLSDKKRLEQIFTSGEPHFVLCANDSANAHVLSVFNGARPYLRSEGVDTVILECEQPLPASGKSIAQKFALQANWKPTWFAVYDGRKPLQISPSFSSGAKLSDEVLKHVQKGSRIRPLTNTIDLERCIADKTRGCVIAFSTRPADDVAGELKEAAAAHRGVTFATLPAGKLALRTKEGAETSLAPLLNAAVRNAREAAAAVGQRGELLVYLRRSAEGWIATVGYVQAPGSVSAKDVVTLLASAKQAAAVLRGGSADGGAAEDVADRLLERDDLLATHNSALVQPGTLYIGRAAPPKAAAGSGGTQSRAQETPDPRLAKREARRAARERDADRMRAEDSTGEEETERATGGPARRAAAPAAAGSSPAQAEAVDAGLVEPEDPAEEAERQRQRREAMAREEAESGFVAHLAEEGAEATGGDVEGGSWAADEASDFLNDGVEDAVDLDEHGVHEEL